MIPQSPNGGRIFIRNQNNEIYVKKELLQSKAGQIRSYRRRTERSDWKMDPVDQAEGSGFALANFGAHPLRHQESWGAHHRLVAQQGDLMDLSPGAVRATYARGTITVENRGEKSVLIEFEFLPIYLKP
jgi:hypothetical protein